MFTVAMCAATLAAAIIGGWFIFGGMFSRDASRKCAVALGAITTVWIVTAVGGMSGAWIGVVILALVTAFMGLISYAAGEN